MNYKIIIKLFGKKAKLEDIEFIPKNTIENFIPNINTEAFMSNKWKPKRTKEQKRK